MVDLAEIVVDRIVSGATSAGDRVHPNSLPQEPTMPAVTYSLVSRPRPARHHAGHGDFYRSRYQLDCWGDTYRQARDLASEVATLFESWSAVVDGVRLSTEVDTERDDVEPERTMQRRQVDVVIQHS